jgi:tetratricopeptide (TPR) repeat protein
MKLRGGSEIKWVALADADFVVQMRWLAKEPSFDVNTIQIHAALAGHPHNALHMLIHKDVFRWCRYRLWTHEFLECPQTILPLGKRNTTFGHYDGFYHVDHADGKSRPEKVSRDISLLKGWLSAVNETDLIPRALYYLARAYEDAGNLIDAMDKYREHNTIQPFTNYLFYAKYRMALIHVKLNKTYSVVERSFLDAYQEYDGYFRREPLYYLTRLARLNGLANKCILYGTAGMNTPPIDHARMPLFLEPALFEWALQEELAYCLIHMKQTQRAREIIQYVLETSPASLDAASKKRIQALLT